MNFTDVELLEFLEANNKEPSFKNLRILKEGIASGKITLTEENEENVADTEENIDVNDTEMSDEAPVEETGAPSEEIESDEMTEKIPTEEEMAPAGISISIPTDGSLELQANNKVITADPQGNVNVQITERFLNSKNTNLLLESFLIDDCSMSLKEYKTLTEDVKVESIKEIATTLLNTIQEKLNKIDTTVPDRSRGDIKQLRELESLQDTITQLETVVERDENSRPEYSEALGIIIKSILYINQYSNTFKEAYRNKKTLMIMKYQSLILSLISSVSYLMSTIIDYSDNTLTIKPNQTDILNFAPLRALENFIRSVDSGEFKTVIRDVTVVREFYLEVPVEKMEVVLEATDYVPMIIDGIKNIADAISSGDTGKILNLVYKAAGLIVLLFSLRDVFYTLFKMKTRVNDMVGGIQNFSNINGGGGVLNKINSFVNKFKTDAEASSDFAKREIEDENRDLLAQVKNIQVNKPVENPMIDTDDNRFAKAELVNQQSGSSSSAQDLFGFDF